MVISRPLHVREPPRTTLDPLIDGARRTHAYDRQKRGVQPDLRETRRRRRYPQRAQRPSQFREGIRRILCAWGVRRKTLADRGRKGVAATHCEGRGPAIEPRGDLGVLVRTHCSRWRVQVRRGALVRFLPRFRECVGGWAWASLDKEATQARSAVDDGAPDRYGLGKRIGEALAGARRVYDNEPGGRGRHRKDRKVKGIH